MQKTVVLNKHVGQTPLECLELWRGNNPEYRDAKLAYAGRLDPMAEGQLLVLIGDECKRRSHYLGLDKEYEFEILLGVETDTQDILGVMQDTNKATLNSSKLDVAIQGLQGKQKLPYPAFSSKTVDGKPLLQWALEGRIDEITRPVKEVEIYQLESIGSYTVDGRAMKDYIHKRIGQVTPVTEQSKSLGNDFRRVEVLEKWDQYLDGVDDDYQHTVLQMRCVCSSGTYMRTLASQIAEEIGTVGLAWSITRTRMGRYKKILGRFGLWTTQY